MIVYNPQGAVKLTGTASDGTSKSVQIPKCNVSVSFQPVKTVYENISYKNIVVLRGYRASVDLTVFLNVSEVDNEALVAVLNCPNRSLSIQGIASLEVNHLTDSVSYTDYIGNIQTRGTKIELKFESTGLLDKLPEMWSSEDFWQTGALGDLTELRYYKIVA